MSVPFLDLKAQHHQIYNEIDDRITDVIANTAFIMGKHVREFEEEFAEIQGAKYCVGVSSGTDALHVALLALGIGAGDRVIVPVNTFIATAEAVSLCGAEPVFVDCDQYYNLDVEKLSQMLSALSHQPSALPKAVIPVHLYGQPANMDEIMAVADEYGLKVVEDCCQAHLAKYNEKFVGNFGNFGAFSFYPGKNLGAYGEAGALITNDKKLYEKAKMLRQHGETKRYQHQIIGHNYRMEAIQGAVLATKLKYLDEWTEKRRSNASFYNELLKDIKEIQSPNELGDTYCVYHLYVIQAENRDDLRKYLQEKGISTGLHYPLPLHLQEAYGFLGYKEGDFPVAEKAAKRILSLPMYPELTKKQIEYVVNRIKEFYQP
ncbi:MAG: aminotransferase class I/II-fold pyridoxal phosphate-dependent enzyme [Nitrospiraceae bacterium]|nr:aminotransferase class I/II-fold pyridoxal phosphate-dependent enzyme [Nitrospiraceae bacterium]